ncbi:hypothetical protein DPMN_154190 [Dreissena polymorpha]|uniref:Uncharacterized protein n=1 Tax=Dreissena polymorpha TaxID=45954 RepID=A0A9D4JA45_DREPO|nr:hypothetical protein DPMN_154190 [Dreissena polymorpha]
MEVCVVLLVLIYCFFTSGDVDVFIVITKCDLVQGLKRFSKAVSKEKGTEIIKAAQFKKTEEEVANVFNIKGVQKHTSIHWMSYVGDSEDDPYIANIALEFIKQMMQPKRQKNRIKLDTILLIMRLKLKLKKLKTTHKMYALCVVIGAFVAFYIIMRAIIVISRPVKVPGQASYEL